MAMTLSDRIPIGELRKHVGEVVLVTGWAAAVRKQKAVQFVILREGFDRVQLVNDRGASPEIAEEIDALRPESVVLARGTVEENERVKLGGLEIRLEELVTLSLADELPIGKDAGLDARLDWRFLDLRSEPNQLMMRVQTIIEREFRNYCLGRGMVEINSPKLMASPSESRSELFEVKYFDRKAYLAQSPQFFKQMGIVGGLPGVFETGPVFRANPSFTSRHDTEFTSIDIEIPWVSSHEDVMRFEEQMLSRVLAAAQDEYGEPVERLFESEIVVPSTPFPRISHADAIAAVEDDGYTIPRADGDLDPEAERRLSRIVERTHGHQFVFVTDYPASVRPFYHMRQDDAPQLTKSFDLIWKGVEITTGAQREHRYDRLVAQAREKGHQLEELQFYLDFFRFGCPPHGGFGLGLTRLLMLLLSVANVREVTYLYRGPNRLAP
jgi:aspartyl/asparaginyl-tRNA synthetase